MSELLINGIEYNYKPGFSIKRILSDTLDTALVIIPQVTEMEIEPLDRAELHGKKMYVSAYTRKVVSFESPRVYNYQVELISMTMYLQRIWMPNRSVTQPIVGTKKTIYEVLNNYIAVYAPSLSLSMDLYDKTYNVTCPEVQWNAPSLYEVMNDLLSVVGCVVTMTDYDVVSVIDINARGSAIDESKLNNFEVFQSVETYANEIESNVSNAVYRKRNVKTFEIITPRTTQDAMLTTDNAELILSKPVYAIDKIELAVYTDVSGVVDIDITDHVVEKTVYDTYYSSAEIGIVNGTNYKRNAIYYTEGSNVIKGLSYSEPSYLGFSGRKAIVNIAYDILGISSLIDLTLVNSDIPRIGFRVWYTTQEDVKFTTYKDDTIKNSSILVNNQDTSYVDLSAVGTKNKNLVNQMANRENVIYGRYETEGDIPELGDTIDSYVLVESEVAYHQGYFQFTGKLYDNYVMQNMYVQLKNKRRFLQITSAKDSFLSRHLNKYILTFSLSQLTKYAIFENYLLHFGRTLYFPEMVEMSFVYADTITRTLAITPSIHVIGNAILVSIEMVDNNNAGVQIVKVDSALINKETSYVDVQGEFDALQMRVFRNVNDPIYTPQFLSEFSSTREVALERTRLYPELIEGWTVNEDNMIFDTDLLYRYKDNREITAEVLQFTFMADSDIYIGSQYYEDSPLSYIGDVDKEYYVYVSTSELYVRGASVVIGTLQSGVAIQVTFNRITNSIPLATWQTMNVVSWGIADADGNLILGVNGDDKIIYLNSSYAYDPIIITISDVDISGSVSVSYMKGTDTVIDDVDISGYVTVDYAKAGDIIISDVAIFGAASATGSQGNDYNITDVAIFGYASATSAYIPVNNATISDVSISGYASVSYTGVPSSNLTVSDVDIFGYISESHTGQTLSGQYIWVDGGTVPVGGAVCSEASHVDNVRCDATPIDCEFVIDYQYVAGTNESTSQPTCGEGGYTNCTYSGGGQWFCTVYVSDVTYEYTNCEVCTAI